MSFSPFYKHMIDLVDAIDMCESKRYVLPCLTLLYSGIDVMASLNSEPGERNEIVFVRWVNSYLLTSNLIECTAIDLYAARCGIVHTFTAHSTLYERGKARRIAYAWGDALSRDLNKSIEIVGYPDLLSIHLSDLIRSFREGVAKHLDNLEKDAALKERFERASGFWFASQGTSEMREFLAVIEEIDR